MGCTVTHSPGSWELSGQNKSIKCKDVVILNGIVIILWQGADEWLHVILRINRANSVLLWWEGIPNHPLTMKRDMCSVQEKKRGTWWKIEIWWDLDYLWAIPPHNSLGLLQAASQGNARYHGALLSPIRKQVSHCQGWLDEDISLEAMRTWHI